MALTIKNFTVLNTINGQMLQSGRYTSTQLLTILSQNLLMSAGSSTNYDYEMTVTFTSDLINFVPDYSLNNMFNTRTFIQNSINSSNYDINLILNQTALFNILNSTGTNKTVNNGTNCIVTNMDTTTQPGLGNRLLEIVALKLFGNAKACAPILNDNNFTSNTQLNNIMSGISNSINTDANLIFNQYSTIGRIGNANVLNSTNFNFANLNMSFVMYLTGNISSYASNLLKNGYVGAGGDIFNNGSYNVPITLVIKGG